MLPKTGRVFPSTGPQPGPGLSYPAAIAGALENELGDTHRAIKTAMRWTGASERTIKNWYAGTHGPSGEHLVSLIRDSDAVFAVVLSLAGRDQAISATKLIEAREKLLEISQLISEITA